MLWALHHAIYDLKLKNLIFIIMTNVRNAFRQEVYTFVKIAIAATNSRKNIYRPFFATLFSPFSHFSVNLLIRLYTYIATCSIVAKSIRAKRQSEESSTKKDESYEQELCKGKDAGEWFRLVANDGDACRDVIQCTSSVSMTQMKFKDRSNGI